MSEKEQVILLEKLTKKLEKIDEQDLMRIIGGKTPSGFYKLIDTIGKAFNDISIHMGY